MHMGRLPGPEPACIPYPGYATYHPYGVPPHWMRGPAPPYTPVVPSTDAGAGVAHHTFQVGQNGHYPTVGDVSRATQIGQYLPPNAAAPPPAHTLYHQPFPSIPGGANPYAYAPPIPHQGIFNQHHGPELSMGSASSSLPQAPGRVVKVRKRRKVKQTKTSFSKIYNDALFVSFLYLIEVALSNLGTETRA
ncbi:uncharacterized protein F5891DRAFT_1045809 [Suillus fuscotomentosus]|uniref:Uncharacterized protein n=1 Tax=Suillus fuscotomentosus TaxID=1912939 RepID=A0AAD4E2I8_9AGAM|nr:uncharacterized protein F5891DRAFT_1045809 [Suillus fuscotomentosus]KAG1898066.1 hypothetical protein F5891DRAFT_1045809 [Suillus fuscotomentosus]